MWLAVLRLLASVAAHRQQMTRSSQSSSRWLQCVQVPHVVCRGGRLALLFLVGLSLNVDFRREDGIDNPREDPPLHPSSPPVASPATTADTLRRLPDNLPSTSLPAYHAGAQVGEPAYHADLVRADKIQPGSNSTWYGDFKSGSAMHRRISGGAASSVLPRERGREREGRRKRGRRWWGRRVVMWHIDGIHISELWTLR